MERTIWKTTTSLITGILMMLLAMPAIAQEGITVTDQSADFEFRDHLTFNLSAEGPVEISDVDLFFRVVGQLATSRNAAEFTPGTSIEAEFVYDQTDVGNYFPPGTELEYWWKVTDADGNEFKTERERLTYLDNRYPWQTMENERLTLYWYEGSDDFGQALFDRANVALDTLESDIGIALEDPIKIFIYGNHQDLLGALSATAQEWTGGVAYTQFGVVVIGIHPVQIEWGLNAMTHEMSHLVIHQATDNPLGGGLPRWLDEGIAVYNENRDELDEDFRPQFEYAVINDSLMTLRTLSSPFPADPVKTNLAYGQSGAVVRFIVDTYGPEAMAELLAIFAEGALYDEAFEQALGVTMDGLDNAFRSSLELPPLPGTEAVEVAPVEEEAAPAEDAEVTPTSESQSTQLDTTKSEPTTQPQAQIEGQASAGGSNDASQTESSPAGALPCVAGMLALLIMGSVVYGVRAG